MKTISARHRWLLFFLWLAVSAWGIGLGAKLFELTVLIPAWAANPPQSLNLLPYGPRWPNNPGDFFQPLSAALVLATVGTLVAGWKTRPPYKGLLWLSLGALILKCSGKDAACKKPSCFSCDDANTKVASMTFSSSRMLPGHVQSHNARKASVVKRKRGR